MADYGATDRVRRFVVQEFFEPARRRGEVRVTIHAKTVSKLMEERNLLLPNRYPVICGAMKNSGFASKYGVRLEEHHGPHSGLSSAATFTFVLEPSVALKDHSDGEGSKGSPALASNSKFMALRGILRDTYAELGGAQAFHESERESWER